MTDSSDELAARALIITERIRPYLAGIGTETQSAVLANLTALWIAGHICPTPEATAQFRKGLLDGHMQLVRDLVEPSEREILDRLVGREVSN